MYQLGKNCGVVLLATAVAGLTSIEAQAANPPAAAPQAPTGRSPQQSQQPVRMNYNPAVNDAAIAYQRNGGSLLQATLLTAPELPIDAANRPRDTSFFSVPEPEPRTIRKHDLVTIVVREESAFSIQGTTDTKRDSAIEAKIDEFVKLKLSNFEIKGGAIGANPPSLKASGNRTFKGEATVDRTESLTTRITGEVVDVKPNGTLVLQARKSIKTDDEEQQMTLTGTCRVEDITAADNTVLSTQLYDLRAEKTHKGAVRSATKRTWLNNILDAISPF